MRHAFSAPTFWADYAKLQNLSDHQPLNHKGWATEEELNEFLKAISENRLPNDTESRSQWLNNLATNRAKKFRRRQTILKSNFAPICRPYEEPRVLDRMVVSESLRLACARLTPDEWKLFLKIARGDSYQQIGQSNGSAAAATKTRVSRCRSRIRRLLPQCAEAA
jgi:DNA-directed RNA polymerase specialized sigma24 family protein